MAGTNIWAELAKAGSGMVNTGFQASEMMVASSSVVGARMTIMGKAALRPLEGDYVELSDMVHEKVVAISKVNQALVNQWSVMIADATEQACHLTSVMFGGRPLNPTELSELAERWMAHGTRMITGAMDVGGLALAPVHQQATANARRLG